MLLCASLLVLTAVSFVSSWMKPIALCPTAVSILPCYCQNDSGVVTVICENMTFEEELVSVMTAAKKKSVHAVQLKSLSLRYIPAATFNETDIKFLSISDSSIMSLTDSERALMGIETTLEQFIVDNCAYANKWEWSQLQKLSKVRKLEVSNSDLLELREDFLKLGHLPLTVVDFQGNGITDLPYKAFATFVNLERLHLERNALTSLHRSMLPVPAKKLHSIGLSGNRIRTLMKNAFSDMPSLRHLYLGENPLQKLNSDVFAPIWSKIHMFLFQSTDLTCDCEMTWFTQVDKTFKFVHGACVHPPELNGKKIKQLERRDLKC